MWQHAMEQPPFQHVAQSSKPQTVPKKHMPWVQI